RSTSTVVAAIRERIHRSAGPRCSGSGSWRLASAAIPEGRAPWTNLAAFHSLLAKLRASSSFSSRNFWSLPGEVPLISAKRSASAPANGLGGYASGTLAGIASRRYHGLLIAALEPPVGRMVLVGGLVERASFVADRPGGRTFSLDTQEYAGGTIDPHGYRLVESFVLDGSVPTWTF